MTTKFKPMLAENIKPEEVTVDVLGSIKLEGVRGIITPEDGLVGRSLKPINNSLVYQREDIQSIEKYCADNGIMLEGEFYVHGWTFNRIDSCLRGEGNIDARALQLHIFDCYVDSVPDAPFTQRVSFYNHAVAALNAMGIDCIKACEQTLMGGADEIREAYAWAIENEYEGFCLKAADAPYKMGRSTKKQQIFVRIKPEETYDAVVLEIIERFENLNESQTNELGYQYKKQDKNAKRGMGMAQTALVYTPKLGEVHKVSLTRGLTDPDRMRIWEDAGFYEGKCIQFVGIPVPGQAIPRSPRFDKWRHDIDVQFLQHNESDTLMVEWDAEEIERDLANGCDIIPWRVFKSQFDAGWSLEIIS